MTKRVNIAVFHVLKSIVDSKVAVAKQLVKRARVAQEALPGLCSHLHSLQEWERQVLLRYSSMRLSARLYRKNCYAPDFDVAA